MNHNRSRTLSRGAAAPALILVAFGLSGCGRFSEPQVAAQEKTKAAPPTQVATVKPDRKTIRRMTEQPGHIEAFEETPLFAKISGYVRELHVDIGDRVDKDKVLAELWVPELGEELKQKQALVMQSKTESTQAAASVQAAAAGVSTAKAKITEAQAATKRSDADHDRWKAELARIERLAGGDAIQKKVVEETQAQLRASAAWREEAAAKIESARAGLEEANAKLTKAKADETAAEAKIAVAEADEARTRAMLQYAKITAPFDGTVTQRNVHTGHFIPVAGSREPLFVVIRTDPVRVFVDVPEKDALAVDRDNAAIVRVQANGNAEFSGAVARTAWALDRTARTLRVEIDVPNPDGKLRPGMYASASIVVAEHADVLAVPASAVFKQGDKFYCASVADGAVHRLPVTTGFSEGGFVEITSGLRGDEAVVKANASSLNEGQTVQVTNPQK